ncbi:MAG: ATP:cob(I)alamin adenosyltransferase [Alphaproteobacteria bacterium]|nr:ATP:cob(I)alamin adenosyltransferase [Alphaproteobacteria bacterium]
MKAKTIRIDRVTTRGGDKGESSLVGGQRLSKSHALFGLIGDTDAVNTQIGLVLATLPSEFIDQQSRLLANEIRGTLAVIQQQLFDMGADLATPFGDALWLESGGLESKGLESGGHATTSTVAEQEGAQSPMALRITEAHLHSLDAAIEKYNAKLPPLKNFIMPGGHLAAAHLHGVRCAARLLERGIVAAIDNLNPFLLPYANRLSDLMFVLARVINALCPPADAPYEEILWDSRREAH